MAADCDNAGPIGELIRRSSSGRSINPVVSGAIVAFGSFLPFVELALPRRCLPCLCRICRDILCEGEGGNFKCAN
jgi:hypothetical protein